MRWAVIVPLLCTTIASAQALLSPSDAERERQRFAPDPDEVALKCEAVPVAPTVNLAFRTEAGYLFRVPRSQYAKPIDGWTVFTAITPEHGNSAYLMAHTSLEQARNISSNFEIAGSYFLGSGHFTVESTLRDSLNGVCRQHWKVDVAPARGDRGIPLALASSAIEDHAHADLPGSVHPADAPPMRVTILLDTAAFSQRRTVIVDRDRERMTQSLIALVEHLPAATLNVTAFSLEQQREIFHASTFRAQDLARLNTAIDATPQASVDASLLDPHGHVEYLMAFMSRILKTTGKGDTVIFLGPTSRFRDAVPKDALPATESRFFYVRYERFAPISSGTAGSYINIPVDDPRTANASLPVYDPIAALNRTGDNSPDIGAVSPARSVDASYGQPDIISKAVKLLNGKNFIVHSAAEMADAIRKIEGRR
jgi:hypothetical protein